MKAQFGHFRLDRSFGLAPDRLWHLLTDPQARTRWAAPSDEHALILEASDLSEGGRDRHRCGPSDSPDFTVDTIWYRLIEPEYACFTENLFIGDAPLSTSLVAYGLTASAAGTDLSIDVAVTSHTEDSVLADHREGWTHALATLAKLAEDAPA